MSGLILYFENPKQNWFRKTSKSINLFLKMIIFLVFLNSIFLQRKVHFPWYILESMMSHRSLLLENVLFKTVLNSKCACELIHIKYGASYFALGHMIIGRNFFSSTLWLTFNKFLRHKSQFLSSIRKSCAEWRKNNRFENYPRVL